MPDQKQNLPTKWKERELLREKGQFWTPAWVAHAMVTYATMDNPNLLFDPAAGTGIFYDALKDTANNTKYYGLDIDPSVFDLGRKLGIYDDACRLEERDFITNTPEVQFPSIVANPPYIRHHRLNKKVKERCQKIASNHGLKIDGRAGLHVFFFIQSLAMLETNGRLAYIVPAEICEGVFAKTLWTWVIGNYCLEYIITFDPEATPFPNVDINAVVILLKKTIPTTETVNCIKCHKSDVSDLSTLLVSKQLKSSNTISIRTRDRCELLDMGLTRPKMVTTTKHRLGDFAKTMRGVATGCNEFFFLTKSKIDELGLPEHHIKRAIGRTRDVSDERITEDTLQELDNKNRPTYLLSIGNIAADDLDFATNKYVTFGEQQKVNERALIKTRKPWYKMEVRVPPPILFAYLGRRNIRFIYNELQVIPLTSFICIYPHSEDASYWGRLWKALNDPLTLENLVYIGKSYGSGAIKVEPRLLEQLSIPDSVTAKFNLCEKSITPA